MIVVILICLAALAVGVGIAIARHKREGTPVFLLADGVEGRELFKAKRVLSPMGVRYRGVTYPDELLDDLGYSVFALADELMVPADGDMSHRGDYPDLKPIGQRAMRAHWDAYDTARRRMNFSALMERGDGTPAMLKSIGLTVVVLINLYLGFAVWGVRSETSKVSSSLVVVSGQLARLTGTGSTTVPPGSVVNPADHSLVPPVPTASAGPAGDPGRKP